jgi:hypothetical protein
VSKICQQVVEKHLEGKEYDEDASKDQVVAICEEIKNRAKGKYPSAPQRDISACLKDYHELSAASSPSPHALTAALTPLPAPLHVQPPAEVNMPRYKLVIQASLGQMKDQVGGSPRPNAYATCLLVLHSGDHRFRGLLAL